MKPIDLYKRLRALGMTAERAFAAFRLTKACARKIREREVNDFRHLLMTATPTMLADWHRIIDDITNP